MIDIGLQFTLRRTAPSVPGPPHNRGFTISLTHTTLTRDRHPCPGEIQTAVPASESRMPTT